VPFAIPVLDDQGQIRDLVSAGISLGALSDAVVTRVLGSFTSATIIDFRDGGLIIASEDPQLLLTPVPQNNAAFIRLLTGESGVLETRGSDGELALFSFTPMSNLPWGVMVSTPSKTAFAVVDTMAWVGLLITALVTLFGVLVSLVLVRGITSPLNRLLVSTKEIGLGNLEYKVAMTSKDEIGELSRAFGGMTEKLSKTLVSRDKLMEEVAQRKRVERERDNFTEELKVKSAEMERFTYTVSHELKSPLVTIKTFLGYLKHDLTDPDTGRLEQDMLYMNGATDKMGGLLEELLQMSRIGRVVNPAVAVTFQELAQQTISLLEGRIEDRRVKVQVSAEPITLYGDRSRLVEIWQNLVENAVKYMGDQPSPQVDIGVERRGYQTVFFVRDNGIGIDPRYQTKLFNMFEKINPKSEGGGMGLSITKRIVELYKGKIWLESKGLGQGTCFWFTLPVALKDEGKGGQA